MPGRHTLHRHHRQPPPPSGRSQRGKGAKYTRGRGPVVLVHQESCPDRSAALRRERAIKALSRSQKLALCHLPDA